MKKETYEKPQMRIEEIELGSFGEYGNESGPIWNLLACWNVCCN